MKTVFTAVVALWALSFTAEGAQIYRIDFSATVTAGLLKVVPQTALGSVDIPFVPGGSFSGTLFADLDQAAPPQQDAFGVHWVAPLQATFQLDLPQIAPDTYLPVPNTFAIEQSFNTSLQLQFATAQVVFPRFTFEAPDPPGHNYKNDGLFSMFLGPAPGITIQPGVLVTEFGPLTLNNPSGRFQILHIDQVISQTPPLFGLTEFYDIGIDFTVTSATARIVPEPATAALLGVALSALSARRRRSR